MQPVSGMHAAHAHDKHAASAHPWQPAPYTHVVNAKEAPALQGKDHGHEEEEACLEKASCQFKAQREEKFGGPKQFRLGSASNPSKEAH